LRSRVRRWLPALIALLFVVAVCVFALTQTLRLHEPDPYAYRASLAALKDGHITLSVAEYQQLAAELAKTDDGWSSGMEIAQWTRTAGGRLVSEKNPGYAFLVLPL